MKDAILVLGPESTGTRLATSLLLAGGCAGDATHFQPFDSWQFGDAEKIVWRRSFPWTIHRLWPEIGADLLRPLHACGYEVRKAVVTTRDWYATAQSQVRQKHVSSEAAALENMAIAYREIFRQLELYRIAPRVLAYDALIAHKDRAARPLLRDLGLDAEGPLPPVRDESTKYYGTAP
jgi:hypothetical protein